VAKSGEHRMLFDIRGRRKRVIQVVYAALALLMALSLFTVVGPLNIGDVFGGGGGSADSSVFLDEAKSIERKLAKDPRNETLLIRDIKARSNAARTEIEVDSTGAQTGISEEGLQSYEKAADAWTRYIKLDPKQPNATAAQLAATALISSATLNDLDTKIKSAADAQEIFAEERPSANAYLTLAQYRYLSGDVKGAQQAGEKAKQEVPASQRKLVDRTLAQYKAQSAQIRKQAKKAAKVQGGVGKQALENPVGGLAGGGSGAATSP
jgi:tetratricopeptide (TPR) repeat protein